MMRNIVISLVDESIPLRLHTPESDRVPACQASRLSGLPLPPGYVGHRPSRSRVDRGTTVCVGVGYLSGVICISLVGL